MELPPQATKLPWVNGNNYSIGLKGKKTEDG
jgi:hypothetical protein